MSLDPEAAPRRSRPRSVASVPALVLGLNPNALGTIRSLVSSGIPVIAIDRAPDGWLDAHLWMSSRTRLCRKIFLPRGGGADALLRALIELGPTLPGPVPVFPSGDDDVLFLMQHRERLSPWYVFHLPTSDAADLFIRKVGFHAHASLVGVPVPRTVTGAESRNPSPESIDEGFPFPCLVKPEYRDERWDRLFAPQKALMALDRADLGDKLRQAEGAGVPLLVQEMIPGPDSELFFSHAFFGADGRIDASWTGHKLRQLPIHVGTSTFAVTEHVPQIVEYTERLLRPLGFRGYASVEFKRDHRDGQFKVMEVTVSRTWYPHLLGAIAGMNLPERWYRDLRGADGVQPATAVPDGIKWVDEYRDLIAAREYIKVGELDLPGWIASFRGCRGGALLSLRDPMPGVFMLLRLAISAGNAIRRGRAL